MLRLNESLPSDWRTSNGDANKVLSEVIDEESLVKLVGIVGKEIQQTMTLIEQIGSSSQSSGSSISSSRIWNSAARKSVIAWLKKTGHGGLGQVWIARDLDLNRRVALKTIKDKFSLDDQIVSRFVREAQITDSSNIPTSSASMSCRVARPISVRISACNSSATRGR